MDKLEIYDEDTLNEFELNRQNNIIRNYEFMICGKNCYILSKGKHPNLILRYQGLNHYNI